MIAKHREKLAVLFTAFAWLSILPGQLFRWEPAGLGAAGILASDVAAILSVPFALYLLFSKKEMRKNQGILLLVLWMVLLIFSWLFASIPYMSGYLADKKEVLVAAGYLARLLAYLLTFIVAYQFANTIQATFLRYAVTSVIALFLLGMIVFLYLPDFAPLANLGWDPHVGRFTSTWLDPNYLGSFIALVFGGALCFEKSYFKNKKHWLLLLLFLLLCAAIIYLTVSRSAMLTLGVAGLVAAARTSWRAVAITAICLILLAIVPSRLQDRLLTSASFIGGGAASGGGAAGSADPTANARVESWKKAWQLTQQSPLLGIGYNYYEVASKDAGLLAEGGETRGTTGSDSSLLTLLATTGWVGLIGLALFFGYLAYRFVRSKTLWASIGLAVLLGMIAGSQFNNLLLYPLVLLPFMVMLGIAYQQATHE